MTDALQVKGLCKSYGKKEVLKGIDLCVHKGDIFALLGVNGAGKTTTLPKAFVMAGKLFPAAWGYAFMTESAFTWHSFWPLLIIFLAAVLVCAILLKKIETR